MKKKIGENKRVVLERKEGMGSDGKAKPLIGHRSPPQVKQHRASEDGSGGDQHYFRYWWENLFVPKFLLGDYKFLIINYTTI